MHFHFINNIPTSKDITSSKDQSLHYHEANGKRTTDAKDDAIHIHRLDSNETSQPVDADSIQAEQVGDNFKVSMGTGGNQIQRDLSEKELMAEFKQLGLFSDSDIAISKQLGTNILKPFIT